MLRGRIGHTMSKAASYSRYAYHGLTNLGKFQGMAAGEVSTALRGAAAWAENESQSIPKYAKAAPLFDVHTPAMRVFATTSLVKIRQKFVLVPRGVKRRKCVNSPFLLKF